MLGGTCNPGVEQHPFQGEGVEICILLATELWEGQWPMVSALIWN